MKIYKGPSTSKWRAYNLTELVALGYTFWISLENLLYNLYLWIAPQRKVKFPKFRWATCRWDHFYPLKWITGWSHRPSLVSKAKSTYSWEKTQGSCPLTVLHIYFLVAENRILQWMSSLNIERNKLMMFKPSPKKKHLHGATPEPWNLIPIIPKTLKGEAVFTGPNKIFLGPIMWG